ncbi:hypothetical protein [Natrinema amylolyticum]|uniref:hypothetical protein n=1 Tax=Natrinema amylolyticum TaxID=2878679 RepID=UPI001CFA0BCA|nr:hypothetical protein [Natrinema amylolyticum]
MRLRTPARERSNAASGSGSTAAPSRGRRLVRHLFTAVGLLAFTYAVLRVLGPRDDVPVQSVDEVRDEMEGVVPDELRSRAADAVPGDRSIDTIRNRAGSTVPDDITQISIEGPRSEESEQEPGVESPTETDEGGSGDSDVTGLDEDGDTDVDEADTGHPGDVIDEAETNADYTDEDRSDEEIAERAEPDVQDEPAEPGEMAVDDDVADELVDADVDTDADSEGDAESEE